MKNSILRSTLAAVALTGVLSAAVAAPAKADTAQTDATIIAILAGIGSVVAATTVEGHTQNGATVYADGHVTEQNGTAWYPATSGLTVSCTSGFCTISPSLAQPVAQQPDTDYGGLDWVAFVLPSGSTGDWASAGDGSYYYFGPDGALYHDGYPGEVQPQDVARNAVGNVATYQFPTTGT